MVYKIYTLATNTKKPVSGIITAVTGERFNHASVAFDSSLVECYSFSMGRRGFVRENPGEWPVWTEFEMFESVVSKAGYEAAKKYVKEASTSGKTFSYTKLGGIVLGRAVIDEEAMFCSEFVERVCLAAGLAPSTDHPELTTPMGVVSRPHAKKIASGFLHQHIIANFNSHALMVTETAIDLDLV